MLKFFVTKKYSIVLLFGKSVYKISFTKIGRRLLLREWQKTQDADRDTFFGDYVAKKKWCGNGIKVARLMPVKRIKETLLQNFITHGLETVLKEERVVLKNLIEYETLRLFMEKYVSIPVCETITVFLATVCVPSTSAHGDFWLPNIMIEGNHLRFIDWQNFREKGSLIFDFFHLFINEECAIRNGHWMSLIFKEFITLAIR